MTGVHHQPGPFGLYFLPPLLGILHFHLTTFDFPPSLPAGLASDLGHG